MPYLESYRIYSLHKTQINNHSQASNLRQQRPPLWPSPRRHARYHTMDTILLSTATSFLTSSTQSRFTTWQYTTVLISLLVECNLSDNMSGNKGYLYTTSSVMPIMPLLVLLFSAGISYRENITLLSLPVYQLEHSHFNFSYSSIHSSNSSQNN